jgi:hypothetical protein
MAILRLLSVIVLGLGAASAGPKILLAGDLGGAPMLDERALQSSNQWTVTLTPYGWLPFLKGDQIVRGRSVEIDVTPIDVLRHLDAAPWMSYAEARKGPLALYNDIFYSKLGISGSRTKSIAGLTAGVAVDVEFEQAVIELGGAYQIARWWSGGAGSIKDDGAFVRSTSIDVLAGARYWHQDMAINVALTGTLDLNGLILSGGRAIARQGAVDWIDPLVGLRIRHQLTPSQELMVRGDVGGFDVGSKFSWNLMGAYSFDIGVRHGFHWTGVLGYRALSVDFEKGSGLSRYEYDVLQHGPILGLTARF